MKNLTITIIGDENIEYATEAITDKRTTLFGEITKVHYAMSSYMDGNESSIFSKITFNSTAEDVNYAIAMFRDEFPNLKITGAIND